MSLVNPEPLTVENQQLLQKFTVQRQAFSAAPMPSLGERKAKLKALKQALLKHNRPSRMHSVATMATGRPTIA